MNQNSIIRVRDVMKTQFNIVDGLATVSEALCEAKHLETKCFIIDKRHDDDEYGIVLFSDIAKEVVSKDRAPERVNIYELMSKPVISVDPDMDIRYCTRLFENFGLVRTPVIADTQIIGVVGYTDIVLHGLLTSCKIDYAENSGRE